MVPESTISVLRSMLRLRLAAPAPPLLLSTSAVSSGAGLVRWHLGETLEIQHLVHFETVPYISMYLRIVWTFSHRHTISCPYGWHTDIILTQIWWNLPLTSWTRQEIVRKLLHYGRGHSIILWFCSLKCRYLRLDLCAGFGKYFILFKIHSHHWCCGKAVINFLMALSKLNAASSIDWLVEWNNCIIQIFLSILNFWNLNSIYETW